MQQMTFFNVCADNDSILKDFELVFNFTSRTKLSVIVVNRE